MFFWPGRKVIVSLADGSAVTAVTRFSINTLRLRAVQYQDGSGQAIDAKGVVVVPVSAILSVQVIG